MELRLLEYFLAIAQEKNITKAAEILHITQPALSRSLAQLEEDMGTRLFERSTGPGKLALTDKGLLLCRRAREMLELAEKTQQELFESDTEISGTISIGCGEIASVQLLSELIQSFQQEYPMVKFELFTAANDMISEKMEQGLLDFGLMLDVPESLRYDCVFTGFNEHWVVLMPADDPLISRDYISSSDLKNLPLVLPWKLPEESSLVRWLGTNINELQSTVSCNLTANAATMTRQGLGYALVIAGTVPFDPAYIVSRPLFPELTSPSVLVWKKGQLLSTVCIKFLDYAKYLWGNGK